MQKLPGNGTVCPFLRQARVLTDLIAVIWFFFLGLRSSYLSFQLHSARFQLILMLKYEKPSIVPVFRALQCSAASFARHSARPISVSAPIRRPEACGSRWCRPAEGSWTARCRRQSHRLGRSWYWYGRPNSGARCFLVSRFFFNGRTEIEEALITRLQALSLSILKLLVSNTQILATYLHFHAHERSLQMTAHSLNTCPNIDHHF